MIESFKCKETKLIWNGIMSQKFPQDMQNRALSKLRQLNAAITLDDLKNLPRNNLEKLKRDRKDQMSIRINNQWRICFIWQQGNAFNVEIVDYN